MHSSDLHLAEKDQLNVRAKVFDTLARKLPDSPSELRMKCKKKDSDQDDLITTREFAHILCQENIQLS